MSLTSVPRLRVVDARPVALARIMLAVALGIVVVESSAILYQVAAGRMAYPVLEVLPAPTSTAVLVYFAVGAVAAVLLLLGLLAGPAAAVGAALCAGALLWDQQTYSSHLFLCTLMLGYLAFARSDTRWSVAARLTGRPSAAVPWWPQLLMMTQVSVVYFFTALSKVNPLFLSGEPLDGWTWVSGPVWFFQAMAVTTVATELFLAVALWIPRLRRAAVLVGVGLHAGIVGGLDHQNVVLVGFALTTMSTYWLYCSRPRVGLGTGSVRRPGGGRARGGTAGSRTVSAR